MSFSFEIVVADPDVPDQPGLTVHAVNSSNPAIVTISGVNAINVDATGLNKRITVLHSMTLGTTTVDLEVRDPRGGIGSKKLQVIITVTEIGLRVVEIVPVPGQGFQLPDGPALPAGYNVVAHTKGTGVVRLRAVLNDPTINSTNLPVGFSVSWGGGGVADAGNSLECTVSRAADTKLEVSATGGGATAKAIVYIITAKGTAIESNGDFPQTPFPDFNPPNASEKQLGRRAPTDSKIVQTDVATEYQISPLSFITDGNAGLYVTSSVVWNFKKEVKAFVRTFDGAGVIKKSISTPFTNDGPGLDVRNDKNPYDGNGHIYDGDDPGSVGGIESVGGVSVTDIYWEYNFRGKAQVSLGSGLLDLGEWYLWHVFRGFVRTATGFVEDASKTNEVGPGNIGFSSP